MDIRKRIQTFTEAGSILANFPEASSPQRMHPLAEAAIRARESNPWFTEDNIRYAIRAIGNSMTLENIVHWLSPYMESLEMPGENNKVIGVVTAGNIPLAGFHDFLCVLISGNVFYGKLSGQDNILLPSIAGILTTIDPGWTQYIRFADEPLRNADAVIATGSDNTYRYFDYYFSKYPHIIRKSRNGIAILHGGESKDEISGIASDVMMYFGLGCRSVSKIYIPPAYDTEKLRPGFEAWEHLIRHNKYFNNYEYQKSIRIVNRQPFIDFGNLLLSGESRLASPVSVLNFEYYTELKQLSAALGGQSAQIQCVVSSIDPGISYVHPGEAQKPELWDYADGTDTLRFLLEEI